MAGGAPGPYHGLGSSRAVDASIIVPVRNDAERIVACVAALDAQAYDRDRYEIIVVDNGSTDGTRDLLAQWPRLRVLVEPRVGSYAARNRGIAAARGTVVAFTDADCIPDAEWLAAGSAALAAEPGVGLVAGRIDVYAADPDAPTAVELYEMCFGFPQRMYVERMRFGATANVFTTRSVLDTVGVFDASLASGADMEWGRRVATAGWRLAFCARAVVRHPARGTWMEWRRKQERVLRGHRQLGQRVGWVEMLKGLARLPRDAYRVLRSQRVRRAWVARAVAALVRGRITLFALRWRWLRGGDPASNEFAER